MASALARRIEASKARRAAQSTAGGSALADRIARSRARREGRGEEEEEEEERGFLDRLWYGKEKEGLLASAPKIGRRTMGLEEVPGQFAEVLKSPIQKGLIPLTRLVSGLTKGGSPSMMMDPARIARDPDVQMATTMVDEFGESIVELPTDIREGYPAEGILNLATVMFPGLKGVQAVSKMAGLSPAVTRGLGTSARVAELVADPVQAAYAGTKAAAKAGGRAYRKRYPAKKRLKKVKEALEGEETGPMRSQLAESVVKFFTNLPEQTATKMFDYASNASLRDKMLKGRKDPTGAYAKAQQVLKEHARKVQEEASAAFGRAQASLDEVKIEGRPSPGDALVDIDIRSERGRAFVDEVENMLSQPTSAKPQGFGANLEVVIEYRGGRFGKKIRQEIIPYAKIMDGSKVIPEGMTYNIRVKHGRRAAIPVKDRALIDGEITKMLNATDAAGEYKGITAGNMLNDMEKFQTDLARLTVEDRPSSALTTRLRAAQKDAVKGPIEEAGGNLQYMEDYHLKQLELEQLAEDFGVKKGSPRTVEDVVNNKIGAAYEEAAKLNKLEDIVGAELVAEIVGAQSKRWFGTGLHVKAELSGIMRGFGRPLTAVTTLGVAGMAGAGFWAIAPLPLMIFYSPRAASTLLTHLDKAPRIRKAITGRTDIPIPKTKATELVGLVRRLLEKLEKRGLGMKDLASQGMTFGQLMERLQIEEEQQQR